MSDSNGKTVKPASATPKIVAEKIVDTKTTFAAKIDSATLITSIQKDLLRVHDFAMAQDRSTTFVLADFTLQLKAVVTQEGEKTMFALPTKQGDIDANTMSTLNLTLRPIPLEIKPVSSRKPVEAIEGIGSIIGDRLRAMGIETVSDLAMASPEEVAKANVPTKKATEFISMAKLMAKSNIAGVEGVDEQVAEVLVASKIDSKEKLAQASPEELVKIMDAAVQSGKAKVPKTYRLSVEESKRIINSAKTIVERTRL
jgi:predicted flap endonuclease-1-like 5' DNA nuclease